MTSRVRFGCGRVGRPIPLPPSLRGKGDEVQRASPFEEPGSGKALRSLSHYVGEGRVRVSVRNESRSLRFRRECEGRSPSRLVPEPLPRREGQGWAAPRGHIDTSDDT